MTNAYKQTLRTKDVATPDGIAKTVGSIIDKLNERIDSASRRSIVEFDLVAESPVFPINLQSPGFPVRGVVVMRVYRLDAPQTPLTAGSVDWYPTEEGLAIISLAGVTAGLSFRVALELIG